MELEQRQRLDHSAARPVINVIVVVLVFPLALTLLLDLKSLVKYIFNGESGSSLE